MTRTIFLIIAAGAVFYLFTEDSVRQMFSNIEASLRDLISAAVHDIVL